MLDISKLNNEQMLAVKYNEGPLLVLSGAGSGKTRVITYKIAYLVDNGIRPQNILAITFTNKAAKEMKQRVGELLKNDSSKVFVSTFHSFCLRVLKSYIDRINYDKNFTICDTNDQKKLITQIIKDLGYDDKKVKPRTVMSVISSCKNHNIDYMEYEKNAHSDMEKIYSRIFKEYQIRIVNLNLVDFDDMLLLTVQILKQCEDVRQKLINHYKYILVDEYQDTNLVQFDIVRLLTEDGKSILTVVGDDDQSIYRFRGADIRNILEFEKTYKNAKVVFLTQNYRSTNNILNVANSVIKNNPSRKEKTLWSENGDGAKVKFTEFPDDKSEIFNIISEIKKTNDYKGTAVLYRTNAQSRAIEEMCVKYSIPYSLVGAINFYERKEIVDILAYLKFILNKNDLISLDRIINVPSRGIGKVLTSKIYESAEKNNMSVYDMMKKCTDIDTTETNKNKIKSFVSLIMELEQQKEVDKIIDKLLDICYKEYLIDEYGEVESKERIENINELKNKSISIKENENSNQDEIFNSDNSNPILQFLNEVALVSDLDDMEDGADKITLMTLHASKGLEFDNIYLTGLNEEIFPTSQAKYSDDETDMEEERRLFYVGVTRARKNLFISSAKRRFVNGKFKDYDKSRFIDEIDDKYIDKIVVKPHNILQSGFMGGKNWSYENKFLKSVQNVKHKQEIKKHISHYIDLTNAKTKETSIDYKIGDTVSHDKYGIGIVKDIKDIGREYEVTVNFDDFGERVMFAKFANLKKEKM